MKYLKQFNEFGIFESVSNEVEEIKQIQADAEHSNLDLEDEETQKLICNNIIQQLSANKIDINIDFDKIARHVSTAQNFQKESKIFEKNEQDSSKVKDIDLLTNVVKELEEKKVDFDDLIDKVSNDQIDIDSNKEIPEDVKSIVKGIDKGIWPKLKSWFKSIRSSFIFKGLLKVLGFIGKCFSWVYSALNALISFVLRKLFGLSNVSTYNLRWYIFAPISIVLITVLFWPIIIGAAQLSIGVIISGIIAGASKITLSWSLWKAFYVIVVVGLTKFVTDDTGLGDKFAKPTLFLEFLDGLEKIKGKRFVLSPTVRAFLENLQVKQKMKTFTAVSKKDIYVKLLEVNKQETKRYSRFFETILDKLEKNKNLTLAEASGLPEGIPIYNQLLTGEKVTKKEMDDFNTWIEKRVYPGIYQDFEKICPELILKN